MVRSNRNLLCFITLMMLLGRASISGAQDTQHGPAPPSAPATVPTAARNGGGGLDGSDAGSRQPSPQPPQGFWGKWFARVDKTQAEQPHWITPLITTMPRLNLAQERYKLGLSSIV
jgi:hypothetical protein